MGKKPQGKQYRKNDFSRVGIEQQHRAGHDAQCAGNQRNKGAKADIALYPDIQKNIRNAHEHGHNAIQNNESG